MTKENQSFIAETVETARAGARDFAGGLVMAAVVPLAYTAEAIIVTHRVVSKVSGKILKAGKAAEDLVDSTVKAVEEELPDLGGLSQQARMSIEILELQGKIKGLEEALLKVSKGEKPSVSVTEEEIEEEDLPDDVRETLRNVRETVRKADK